MGQDGTALADVQAIQLLLSNVSNCIGEVSNG